MVLLELEELPPPLLEFMVGKGVGEEDGFKVIVGVGVKEGRGVNVGEEDGLIDSVGVGTGVETNDISLLVSLPVLIFVGEGVE